MDGGRQSDGRVLADEAYVALRRTRTFSRVAAVIAPLVFISVVWLLWRIGGGVDGVSSSLYGRLLLGKLALACALSASAP